VLADDQLQLSVTGACRRVAEQLGINRDTLRGWVKQAQIDAGKRVLRFAVRYRFVITPRPSPDRASRNRPGAYQRKTTPVLTGGEARSEARIRAARRPECSATVILIEPDSAVGLRAITALGEAAAQVARLRVSGWVRLARSDAD
jgi:transposase-like protein